MASSHSLQVGTRRTTQLDRNWYKAWHAWALANFDVITYQGRHGGAKQLMEASI
ncbi:phosphatidylinositol kinase- protein kinase tor1, partial [Tilletia horrida]